MRLAPVLTNQFGSRRLVIPTATLLGVYSLFQVNGWRGPCFEATRASDGLAIDIGFDSTGYADFARMDLWARGTTVTITRIYDQSGNGYDLTPGSAPLQVGNTVNGLRSISFNNNATSHYLANTSMPITQVRNTTCVWAGAMVYGQASGALFEVGSPTWRFYVGTNTNAGAVDNNTLGKCFPAGPVVVTRTGNGSSNRTTTINDFSFSMTANTANSATGFGLGNAISSGSPGRSEFLFACIYDSTMPADELTAIRQQLYARLGLVQRELAGDVCVFAGDSITLGVSATGVSNQTSWAAQVRRQIGRPMVFYNLGVSGQSAATAAANAATLAARSFQSGKYNVAALAYGSNDLAANATAATTYGHLQTIASAYRAAGFNKIIMSSVLPRKASFSNGQTSAGFETARQDLRNLQLAGLGTDFDVLCDVGADSVIGNEANCNATYYFDLVHPTALGYSLMVPHMINALLPVL